MKRILFFWLFTFLFFSQKSFSQTYSPISVSGFNEDVIAEDTTSLTHTSNAMDLSNYVMYSQNFATNAGLSAGIVNNGTIVSGTRTYQLQPFNANNGLHVAQGTSQTLTLTSPASFTSISILGFSTESACTATFTLNFTNGSSTSFSNITVQDWFNGTGNVYCCFGRTTRVISGYASSGLPNNPMFYPIDFALSCADQQKLLHSIQVTITSGTTAASRIYILGLSGVARQLQISNSINNIGCSGGLGSATVTATGSSSNYSYSWNTTPTQTGQTAVGLSLGNHICTITDGSGCSTNDTVSIGQTSSPNIHFTVTHDTICVGQNTQISVTGLSTITWFPGGQTTNSITVSPSITTKYFVSGNGSNGCPGQDSIQIFVLPKLNFNSTPTQTNLCVGNTVQINTNSGGASVFSWTPTNGLSASNIANPIASPTVSTTYFLNITDTNGCHYYDTVKIHVFNLCRR
jgi:hypothetical protein